MDLFKRHIRRIGIGALAVLIIGGYYALLAPPADFPSGSVMRIAQGASAPSVAQELGRARIIKYPSLLRFLLRVSGTSTSVQAGAYRFETPQNVLVVAFRLVTGASGFPPVRITFPEGTSVREMATQVADAFPDIAEKDFLDAARSYEGYLFPDTYLFPPSATAASVVMAMRANFNTKTLPLMPAVGLSGHSFSDIVTLASLVEKEARTTAVRRMVAGILWNRLRLTMPLQVDAVFGYIYGRDTYSPSLTDLAVDSPYNTYTHIGLPPGPINNPGLDALDAALHPAQTDYLYYLTDKNGVMHYATTYADHQANKRKYLP